MKRRFLITGANGQLARAFAAKLIDSGLEFEALSKERLDITDFKDVAETVKSIKPDAIINCSAYNYVDKAEEEPTQAHLVNAAGARNLAEAANEAEAVLVHFSTDYVFDGKKRLPYTIFDEPAPINKYGESKLAGERMVAATTNRSLIIRVSWVFGGKNSFPSKLLEWMKSRNELKIADDQISSPSYAEDIAEATLELINLRAFGLYQITNFGQCSRYEWACRINDKLEMRCKITPVSSDSFNLPAKRPAYSVMDNLHFNETTGRELPDWKDATDRFLKTYL